jgi:hypothetical protein
VRILAGEQYAVSVKGKDFTRQVVEVDQETGEEREITVDLSATDFRNAIEAGDVSTVAEFLPQAIRSQAKEIINMMGAQVAMSDPDQAQITEMLFEMVEQAIDEVTASDDLLAAMRGMEDIPVPPPRAKAVKDYGTREIDYKDIMSRILKSLNADDFDELDSITQDLKARPMKETIDETSAMAGGAVEGASGEEKEVDSLIREDDEEIEENMIDLAWGPANLALDPVERDPTYAAGDEIETLAKRRAGANVTSG